MKIAITWIFLVGMILVNALANILPINGYNTGQISAFYPNNFVPAGFTFSIWGIIYLLLISYTISFTYFNLRSLRFPKVTKYLNSINPLFWITCLLNASWIIAWHYLNILLSVIIMLIFLGVLTKIFLNTHKYGATLSSRNRFLVQLPFTVYLGWISVATIANITALLVHVGWNGMGIEGVYWSAIMMLIAIVLGLYFLFKYKIVGYSLVVAWALWGIHVAQGTQILLFQVSIFGMLLLLLLSIYISIKYKFAHGN